MHLPSIFRFGQRWEPNEGTDPARGEAVEDSLVLTDGEGSLSATRANHLRVS